jgi:hypothetical protein
MTEREVQAKEKMIVTTKFMNRMAVENISTIGQTSRRFILQCRRASETAAFPKGQREIGCRVKG